MLSYKKYHMFSILVLDIINPDEGLGGRLGVFLGAFLGQVRGILGFSLGALVEYFCALY